MWDVGCVGYGMCGMWDVWDVGCVGYGMCGIWDVWDMGSALSSEPSALSPEPPSPGRSPSAPSAPKVHFFAKIAKKNRISNLPFVSSAFIDVFERPKWKSSLKVEICEKSNFLPKMSSKNISKYHSKSTWSILSEKVRKSAILANFCVSGEKVVPKPLYLLSQTHFAKS